MPAFWLLAASFAICGMTTNGLIGTHFIPAANDHGMPTTVAAGLLATIGILDVAGTVFSGWLTDRVDPRLLLVVYYIGRGVSLLLLPVAAFAARRPEHLGVRHLLRAGLGRDRAADDRVVSQLLRHASPGRVRLGVRIAPAGAAIAAAGGPAPRSQGNYDWRSTSRPVFASRRAAVPECSKSAGQRLCNDIGSPELTLALARPCP